MSERDFEDEVSRLVRLGGPRTTVPEAVSRRVHAAVHSRWRHGVVARRRRRMLVATAALLSGLAVITMFERTFRSRTADPRPAAAGVTRAAATLERVSGGELWSGASGSLHALNAGSDVGEGTWLETREHGRAALRLQGGASIRLDTNTRAQIQSTSAVVLDRGAIYVDTAAAERAPLEIRTAHGVVAHLGTQFEVQAAPDFTRVRVREGRVVLVRGADRREADAGIELAAGSDGGLVRRGVPVFGPDWYWVEQAAPEFKMDGQTLEALLRWTARETGWTIRFTSDETARAAADIRLHGSSAGLTPSEALEAALPTCNLSLRLENGTAWIGPLHRRPEEK